MAIMNLTKQTIINSRTDYSENYNAPFIKQEYKSATKFLKSLASGLDTIHIHMIRKLPTAALEGILKLYNVIGETISYRKLGKQPT